MRAWLSLYERDPITFVRLLLSSLIRSSTLTMMNNYNKIPLIEGSFYDLIFGSFNTFRPYLIDDLLWCGIRDYGPSRSVQQPDP